MSLFTIILIQINRRGKILIRSTIIHCLKLQTMIVLINDIILYDKDYNCENNNMKN